MRDSLSPTLSDNGSIMISLILMIERRDIGLNLRFLGPFSPAFN